MKIFLFLFLLFANIYAVGPTKIATFNRALWSEPIVDKASFNKASRHEIISYVKQLTQTDLSSKATIQKFVGRKRVSPKSVQKWILFTQKNLVSNFKEAQKSCQNNQALCLQISNWNDLSKLALSYKPNTQLKAWYQASQTFFSYYLYEQARLASLFPKTTSEIAQFDSSEIQGFNYQDGEFLLTFDDGPKYKRTKAINKMLAQREIHAFFFLLGNNLEKSIKKHGSKKIQSLYQGTCVGSHGFIHKSHQRLKTWKSSYNRTRELIIRNNLNSQKIWFRPPYGQRHQKLISHLKSLGDQVMLWNIDSQDWNRRLNAKKIEDRVLTLMLLHRKGIILFHDIHPKAIKVVKALNDKYQKRWLNWVDCREFVQ
jgi:peptidoglycan/xylan/chitin deacetylase (PgdA/CDA1 family)